MMTQRDEITEAARGWLNTPFHHEARIKKHGVDCLQLIIACYQEAGLLPQDIDKDVYHYSFDAHLHDSQEQYIEALESHGWTRVEKPQAGDVALYKVGKRYSHGAIVLDYPLCIHSYLKIGVCYVDASIDVELINRDVLFFSMGNLA